MELSNEDVEEGKWGLLQNAMCGTCDAAQNWELESLEMMMEAGFRQGSLNACVFCHEQKIVRVVVRGDDFIVLGAGESLDKPGAVRS